MDLAYLREATAEDHERTEGLVPLMRDDLDRAAYTSLLQRFYTFFKGWERWAESCAPQYLLGEMEGRRRSRFLEQDLSFFEEAPSGELYLPKFADGTNSDWNVLGSMYVLEGSTLGGQFIAAHVEKVLHLQRGEGNAFFAGYGDQTGPMWRRFKAVLAAAPNEHADEIVAAAKQTFAAFGDWMTRPAAEEAHA